MFGARGRFNESGFLFGQLAPTVRIQRTNMASSVVDDMDIACLPHTIDFVALAAELQKFSLYRPRADWAGSTALLPAAFRGMKYVDAARLLTTSKDAALRAVGLWATARCMNDKSGDVEVYEGKPFGRMELCLEALRCDPCCSMAYCFVGSVCFRQPAASVGGSAVILPDGRTLTARQLFLEALRHNSSNSLAYQNLGCCLTGDETVALHDGRSLSKKQLYLESMRQDSANADVYVHLGNCISGDETVTLHAAVLSTVSSSFLSRCSWNLPTPQPFIISVAGC